MKKIDKWISELGDYLVSIDPATGLDSSYNFLHMKNYGKLMTTQNIQPGGLRKILSRKKKPRP